MVNNLTTMKKILLYIILTFLFGTTQSQVLNRTVYVDSIWRFCYPDFLTIQQAIDSSTFISSEYTTFNGKFVFNENKMIVQTYINDTLVETSPIVNVEYAERYVVYKTRVVLLNEPLPPVGQLYDGKFLLFYDNDNIKPIMLFGGYTEPMIETAFFCKVVKFE